MKNVLICTPYFAPGYLAGGSVKTIVNTVRGLETDFVFWILTQDRYSKANSPYITTSTDEWQTFGCAQVRYLNPKQRGIKHLFQLLSSTPGDVLFLNSFFSPFAAIKPLICNLFLGKPVLLAPRGELMPGALSLKPWRKKIYLTIFKYVGLGTRIQWLVSSEEESSALLKIFREGLNLHIISDPVLSEPKPNYNFDLDPAQGLQLVFVSRIDRKKNLAFALKVLALHPNPIKLDIFGPIDDAEYWTELQKQIAQLPKHIQIVYRGSLESNQVIQTLASYHALFVPTLGENFGYIFIEALLAGCPLLISRATPFRELEEKGVGWDLDLNSLPSFANAILHLEKQSLGTHQAMRAQTRDYGLTLQSQNASLPAMRALLKDL